MSYAGFWKRVAAAIIDGIIIMIGGFAIGFVFGLVMVAGGTHDPAVLKGMSTILGLILGWIYFAVMESSPTQGTLGKMAMGIKVADLKGSKIDFGMATGRYFGKTISALILLIGFIMVAFTQKKQGLHDMMAGCLVVNSDPEIATYFTAHDEKYTTKESTTSNQSESLKMSNAGSVDEQKKLQSMNAKYTSGKPEYSKIEKLDDFYAQAWDEINDQNKTPDKALWAKSFANAQGNESLTKANYLKLRVEQLSKEYAQNLAKEKERQNELLRQHDALAAEKRKLEWQRQEIEMQFKSYKKIEGQSGDAFCIVCKNVSPINGMFHHKPTDTYYHRYCLPKEVANKQSPKYDIAEIQRLSDKYEDFKDTIIDEVKKTLKTKEEIQILESQSRLPYTKLIELGSPGQLTDGGLSVYKLLIEEIDKKIN